ncbi:MAG: hypothetical protein ACPG4Q_05850 [Phycisphaeraceae bacterium]
MLNLLQPKRFATAMTLSAALLLQAPAWAQSPAELAPADTSVFIHVNEPADWIADLTEGPLGQKWITMIEEAEGSGDLLAAMGMNFDQFMDAYFGKDVVIVSQGKDDDGNDLPGVLFTKVSDADRARAIDSLALKKAGDIAGAPVYTGDDGDGYIVMLDEWVAMADLEAYDYLTSILSQPANAPKLADTDHYAKWTKELPEDRVMTLLAFESADSQHAIGVNRKGKGMDATYLGKSPDFDEMMAMLGETSVADFGPLPAETISAVTFNIEPTGEARANMDNLNMLIGGKSFVDDVLPKLDPPTVLFMGSVQGNTVDPAVGVQVPVVGMAVKMNDATVANDMNTMFDSVVMMANVAVMGFEAGLIPQSTANFGGSSYKVAEIGKPIAQGLEFPELAPMQIVYGVIGDYYVVCSQEQFFKQCVDANKADKNMRIEIEGKPHRLAKTPVLAMNAQPDRFGSLLLSWINLLDEKGLPEAIAGEAEGPLPADIDNAKDVVRMLQQYSLVKMQIWTGEDGLVIGRAQLTAPQ